MLFGGVLIQSYCARTEALCSDRGNGLMISLRFRARNDLGFGAMQRRSVVAMSVQCDTGGRPAHASSTYC